MLTSKWFSPVGIGTAALETKLINDKKRFNFHTRHFIVRIEREGEREARWSGLSEGIVPR